MDIYPEDIEHVNTAYITTTERRYIDEEKGTNIIDDDLGLGENMDRIENKEPCADDTKPNDHYNRISVNFDDEREDA